mgnify:CR=1 FL=1
MRLIDAEKLVDMLYDNEFAMLCPLDEVSGVVDACPTVDAVVVTRCKDCKHYDMGVCLKIYSDGNVHSAAWQSRNPDDFCSYGERKDGECGS